MMTDLQHIKLSDIPASFDARLHRMRTYGYILGSVRSAPNAQQKSSGNVKVTYKFRYHKEPLVSKLKKEIK